MDPSDIDAGLGAVGDAVVAGTVVGGAGADGRRGSGGCANCGARLSGRFCANCGQVSENFHKPFAALVADALEGFFGFDGRFWATFPRLLFDPGRLSRDYLAGKRARFVQPFRLYLFCSLIFFFVVLMTGGLNPRFDATIDPEQARAGLAEAREGLAALEAEAVGDPEAAARLAAARRALDAAEATIGQEAGAVADAPVEEGAATDGVSANVTIDEHVRVDLPPAVKCAFRAALLPEDPPTTECAAVEAAQAADPDADEVVVSLGHADLLPLEFRRLLARNVDIAVDRPEAYLAALQRQAPKVLFALFPLYAALLALMHFWKRKVFIYDHLIVSMHFHSFLFLLGGLIVILAPVLPGWPIPVAFVVLTNVHLYRAHRLVYADGRIGAVLRVALLDIIYLFVVTAAMVALMMLGLLFI